MAESATNAYRLDKTAIAIATLQEVPDDVSYWRAQPAEARWRAMEFHGISTMDIVLPDDFKELLKLLDSKGVASIEGRRFRHPPVQPLPRRNST